MSHGQDLGGRDSFSKVLSSRVPNGDSISTSSHKALGEQDAQEEQVSGISAMGALGCCLDFCWSLRPATLESSLFQTLYKPLQTSSSSEVIDSYPPHCCTTLNWQGHWKTRVAPGRHSIVAIVKVGSAQMKAVTTLWQCPAIPLILWQRIPGSLGMPETSNISKSCNPDLDQSAQPANFSFTYPSLQ